MTAPALARVESAPVAAAEPAAANPLLGDWTTPDGVPPYDRIRPEHYEPAFDAGIAEARANYERIATNRARPTFANTLEAMERATPLLTRTQATFFTVANADATPEMQAIRSNVSPKLTKLGSDIFQDQRLFARVDRLYRDREKLKLTPEQKRLVEVVHRNFVRAGAALSPEARARVAEIDQAISKRTVQFGQNLVAEQKAGDLFLTEAEMAGIPADSKAAAGALAAKAGQPGRFLITSTRSAVEPFLTHATNRAARERVFRAFNMRGDNGNDADNNALIREIVQLRAERAKLLGFDSFADFQLDASMAGTPKAANELLQAVFQPALVKAREEEAKLLAIAAKDGLNRIEPWDWRFYAEKVRQAEFNLDETALKAYLPLDGMVDALMETVNRLWGIRFVERPDVPPYAEGVKVWEIQEADGRKIGLFYADWFTRPTKQPGAWMNSIRVQSFLRGDTPIVVNNCNYTPPPPGGRATISVDDLRTLFHEFGHALHGLKSQVRYPTLSGTAVYTDFVELPSQILEHWAVEPEILRRHAKNERGETIPEPLLQAFLKSRTFNQGFLTVQQLSSAVLDMELHQKPGVPDDFDPRAWEAERLVALGVPASVGMRHRLAHFSHLFAGGYAAKYYSYTWSEAMDADGFDAFKETGNVFDPATAQRFRKEVLEVGNSREPRDSYIAFRGRLPTADALLRNRGLN
ncbi:MAG: M3 family metallopeptidase [Sphingomonadaceae bacterium]